MMFSTAGKMSDTLFCASYHGGISLPGFTIAPVDLGPPDVPAHGVAIRKAPSDGNMYAVVAADACGLVSLRLETGPSSSDPPTLRVVDFYVDSDHEYYHEPAITQDGTVLMTSEKDDWAHFRFWAFDLANRNQKWGKTLTTWPTDSVALEPFQTASAYSLLLETGDAPAQLVRFDLFNKVQ